MPRNVTVTLANGSRHTYNNVPDNITPDQIEQRASQEFGARVTAIDGGRAAAPQRPQAKPQPAPRNAFAAALSDVRDSWNAFQTGVGQAKLDAYHALVNGMQALHIMPAATLEQQRQKQNFQRDFGPTIAKAEQEHPVSFGTGRYGTQAAYTEPFLGAGGKVIEGIGGLTARAAPKVGKVIQNIGKATATGGVGSGKTKAATAAMTAGQRLGAVAERATGGAIAGGGSAALSDQDVTTGAVFGAGLPVVGTVLGKLGGKAIDLTRLSKVEAGRFIRKALGENADAAREAFSKLSPDDQRLAQQVLVESGVEPSKYFGLTDIATKQTGVDTQRAILEQQAAAREARLAQAAGGASEEEVRAATRAGRQDVSAEMAPAREGSLQNLEGVNEADRLAAEARRRQQAATATGQEQEDAARRLTGASAYYGESPAFTRGADVAAGNAEQAFGEAAAARQTANDMEDYVHQAAAEGVKPQRVAPLIAKLREMAGTKGTRADDLQRNSLLEIADKLAAHADENGLINPYDLYQIRKTGVGDTIETLANKITGGREPSSGNLQRTSQLMTSVRGMIDDTMGPEFKDYLSRSAEGYKSVNRQELTGEAVRMYREGGPSKDEFLALLSGNRPKTVGKIMGGGPEGESFLGAFEGDPNRLAALQQSGREIETLNRMRELQGMGAPAAGNILRESQPGLLRRGVGYMVGAKFPAVALAGQGAEMAKEAVIAPRTLEEIANAGISGKNALAAMNQYPTSIELADQINRMSPQMRNFLAQAMQKYLMSPSPAQ